MASSTTVTKTIRIKNETAEYFKDKPLNRYVDSLCDYMISGEIEGREDGISVHTETSRSVPQNPKKEEKAITDSVHTTSSSKAETMIEEDARAFGLETEDFKLKLIEAVDSGKLMYENGEFLGVGAVDTSRFMERCVELGMNPQDTINKITQRLG